MLPLKTHTGESPYNLVFGTEAILRPKVVFSTMRIENFTPEASEICVRENLDLLEEHRAETHLKILHYERAVARLYNRRIRPRLIGMGDVVLRKIEVSDPGHSCGKLAPRWEGPYRVIQIRIERMKEVKRLSSSDINTMNLYSETPSI
ncbi:hypothetical protein GW17_00042121 [Ensete ventricosum]|nr:hypothetical protein GW17_00042121 [Ensete ventricosum]